MHRRVFLTVAVAALAAATVFLGKGMLSERREVHPAAAIANAREVPVDQTVPGATAAEAPAPSLAAAERFTGIDPVSPTAPPPVALTFGPPVWDEQIKAIAREKDPTLRSRALLAMLQKVPEEALAEVAEQAVDGLPDRAYAATALPVVTNPATAGQVMSVLFADLMERPDAITLPTLLQIARNPEHPFGPSAVDNLKLLLRVDRGTDWAAWEKEVQQRVSERR